MTTARRKIVDPGKTCWYHCISKCVRGERLLADSGKEDRKQWIEDRISELTQVHSVSVSGFAILDGHLHMLCCLNPEEAQSWSDEEVIRRWISIYPPETLNMDDQACVDAWIKQLSTNAEEVKEYRERLSDLGWFMKALKEPIARRANKADGVRGPFWQPRYKSIAILDEPALMVACAYIDLNVVAAGIAETPESSHHTSIKQRVDHVRRKGQLAKLRAAMDGSVAGSKAIAAVDQDHWLMPIENLRLREPGSRKGMFESISICSYVMVVEYIGRLHRKGKASIPTSVEDVFTRLETSAELCEQYLCKMLVSASNLRGNFFALGNNTLRDLNKKRERPVFNLSPQVTT